jgi:hypothetical protein
MNEELKERVCLVEIKDTEGYESFEVQKLPDSVLYVDKGGCLVINEEILNNGRITKVTSYLPPDPYKYRHWTQEEMEKECIKHVYYISNVDGGYIGNDKDYDFLVNTKKLILIQKALPTNDTCSIGYSVEENKWYGWSHRAIHGFTIGDKVADGDITATSGLIESYRIQHPEEDYSLPVGYEARDLNGAKRMAIAFAEAVS